MPPSCLTHTAGVPVTGGRTLALVDDAQPAGPFGDEQTAVGKERDAPRRLEPLGDDFELDRLLFGLEDGAFRIDLGLGLALQLTGLIANVEDELPDLFVGDDVLERQPSACPDVRRGCSPLMLASSPPNFQSSSMRLVAEPPWRVGP